MKNKFLILAILLIFSIGLNLYWFGYKEYKKIYSRGYNQGFDSGVNGTLVNIINQLQTSGEVIILNNQNKITLIQKE